MRATRWPSAHSSAADAEYCDLSIASAFRIASSSRSTTSGSKLSTVSFSLMKKHRNRFITRKCHRLGTTWLQAQIMIPDIDIWRSAALMVNNYGDEAATEAAACAGEHFAKGELEAQRVWMRIAIGDR